MASLQPYSDTGLREEVISVCSLSEAWKASVVSSVQWLQKPGLEKKRRKVC
jgi:hypothetical protein